MCMCGSELTALPDGVQRVAAALQEKGHPHGPRMLDNSARTAQEAADALGIAVGQIAKSIIFRRKSDDAAVLVVTSGDRRVDEKKVEAHVGKVGRADADFVKSRTGFSIGGVSPVAHATPPVTLIDQDLLRFDVVWAAAGHPHGVFPLHPGDLQRLTLLRDLLHRAAEVEERVRMPRHAQRAATRWRHLLHVDVVAYAPFPGIGQLVVALRQAGQARALGLVDGGHGGAACDQIHAGRAAFQRRARAVHGR